MPGEKGTIGSSPQVGPGTWSGLRERLIRPARKSSFGAFRFALSRLLIPSTNHLDQPLPQSDDGGMASERPLNLSDFLASLRDFALVEKLERSFDVPGIGFIQCLT
jgi:hypothetical protein